MKKVFVIMMIFLMLLTSIATFAIFHRQRLMNEVESMMDCALLADENECGDTNERT